MPRAASSGARTVQTPQVRGLGGKDNEASRQMFEVVRDFAAKRNARRLESKQDAVIAEAKAKKESERAALIRILDPGHEQEVRGSEIARKGVQDFREGQDLPMTYPPPPLHLPITPQAMARGGDRTGVAEVGPSKYEGLPDTVLASLAAQRLSPPGAAPRDYMAEGELRGDQAAAKTQAETARAIVLQQMKDTASASSSRGGVGKTPSSAATLQSMALAALKKVEAGEQIGITERAMMNKYFGTKSIEEIAIDLRSEANRNASTRLEPFPKTTFAEYIRQAVALREGVGYGIVQPRVTTLGIPGLASPKPSAADFDTGP